MPALIFPRFAIRAPFVVKIVVAELLAVLLGAQDLFRLFLHRFDVRAQTLQNFDGVAGVAFEDGQQKVRRARRRSRLYGEFNGAVEHLRRSDGEAGRRDLRIDAAEKHLRIFVFRNALPRQNPVCGTPRQAEKAVDDVFAAHVYGAVFHRHVVGDFQRRL